MYVRVEVERDRVRYGVWGLDSERDQAMEAGQSKRDWVRASMSWRELGEGEEKDGMGDH